MAVSLVVAQIRGRMAQGGYAPSATLGVVYFSDHYARHAAQLLEALQDEFPLISDWTGAVGVGVIATQAEYMGEPALSVMLLDLPAQSYRVFSGIAPLQPMGGSNWERALVHADGELPDLPDLLVELAGRTQTKSLLGGVSSSIVSPLQLAWSKAQGPGHSGVLDGGLSGVAFAPAAGALQALTQGCQTTGARMRITALQDNVLLSLDGRPALDVLEDQMLVRFDDHPEIAARRMRHIHAALESQTPAPQVYAGQIPSQARVIPLVGVDVARRGIVLEESALDQRYMSFCERNLTAARADLLRMCAELRESLSPAGAEYGVSQTVDAHLTMDGEGLPDIGTERAIAGAIYVSCVGRGGHYFGATSAEMELIRHVLGDIPLVGFFSNGEIAGQQLHRYAGALLVFTQPV